MHFPLQDNQPVFCLQEKISLPLLEVANCILDDLAHFERLQSCQGHVASAETLFSNGKSRPRYLNKSENRKVRRRKADIKKQPAVRDYGPPIFFLLVSIEEMEKCTE